MVLTGTSAQIREFLSRCSINTLRFTQKIYLANFSIRSTLGPRAEFVRYQKESQMAWKAPKIVEVPVGMEINMYMCATRK